MILEYRRLAHCAHRSHILIPLFHVFTRTILPADSLLPLFSLSPTHRRCVCVDLRQGCGSGRFGRRLSRRNQRGGAKPGVRVWRRSSIDARVAGGESMSADDLCEVSERSERYFEFGGRSRTLL